MRFVLSWTGKSGATTNRDLDLFVDFKVSDRFICSVGFYLPLCQGVMTNYEAQNVHPDVNAETISIKTIGDYQYLVYVSEFLNKELLEQPQI